MRNSTTALVLMLAVLCTATGAKAQAPGIDLQLIPKIGAYLPANDLGEVPGVVEEIVAETKASLAVGLAAELDFPLSPWNVRANLDYATGSELSFEEGLQEREADATILALVGDLVFRPLPRVVVVQPYLLGGAGIKRYDFDTDDLGGSLGNLFDDQSDFTVHLGAGLDIGLGPVAFMAELSDYISWFDVDGGNSEMQNDFFGMVGARVGIL